jgi:XTP/dITP diphosphohydrolase
MKLLFATGNPGKVITPQKELAKYGIEVVPVDLGIVEIQAETAVVIARHKAVTAWRKLQRGSSKPFEGNPVLANDAAFHIDGLGGFPGPYVAPVTQAIGLDGYVRLMTGVEDRRCEFSDAWAVFSGTRVSTILSTASWTFERRVKGRLAAASYPYDHPQQKSPLWRLFIPEGFDKTLAEMTDEDLTEHRRDFTDIYREIAIKLGAIRADDQD